MGSRGNAPGLCSLSGLTASPAPPPPPRSPSPTQPAGGITSPTSSQATTAVTGGIRKNQAETFAALPAPQHRQQQRDRHQRVRDHQVAQRRREARPDPDPHRLEQRRQRHAAAPAPPRIAPGSRSPGAAGCRTGARTACLMSSPAAPRTRRRGSAARPRRGPDRDRITTLDPARPSASPAHCRPVTVSPGPARGQAGRISTGCSALISATVPAGAPSSSAR